MLQKLINNYILGVKLKKYLGIIGITIILISISGCVGNSTYTLLNSTFNVPNDFQPGNITTYTDVETLTEFTFNKNGIGVIGVDQYLNVDEFAKGKVDPILYPPVSISTTSIGNNLVTVYQQNSGYKDYFYMKNGKFYSIETSTFSGNVTPDQLNDAMNMIVETMR